MKIIIIAILMILIGLYTTITSKFSNMTADETIDLALGVIEDIEKGTDDILLPYPQKEENF